MSDITVAPPDGKEKVSNLDWIPSVTREYKKSVASEKKLVEGLCRFIERAIGLDNEAFAPGGKDYYSQLIRAKVYALLGGWASDAMQSQQSMSAFFKEETSVMNKPMTSLRDVDEVGNIHFGQRDLNQRWLESATALKVMTFIRRGVATDDIAGAGQ